MNARTIIAADGLPRRAFTVADVERMVEAGVIGEDERVELTPAEPVVRAVVPLTPLLPPPVQPPGCGPAPHDAEI